MERPIFVACESCKNNYSEMYRLMHERFAVLKIVSCEEIEIYSGKFYGKNAIWWLQRDHYLFNYIKFEEVLYDLMEDKNNIIIVAGKTKPENLPKDCIYIERELNYIDKDALKEVLKRVNNPDCNY